MSEDPPPPPPSPPGGEAATDAAAFSPELAEEEEDVVRRRAALRVQVVHEAIRKEGDEELARPLTALAFSGLAAGLSMGFSLVGEGLLRSHLPDTPWRPLIAKLGYTFGFLMVVLGRQQLFTENTLTVVLPLLARRTGRMLLRVMALWAVVLATNLLGALAFSWVAGHSPVFTPTVREAFSRIGHEGFGAPFATIFMRAIFAGWLLALMVWLLPAADANRLPVVLLLTWLVGIGGFSHVIAGSIEELYLVCMGELGVADFLLRWLAPTLLGNVVGGVSLVAVLNHAQVIAGEDRDTRSRRRHERVAKGSAHWHPQGSEPQAT